MKEAEVRDVAETMAKNKPSTIVWAMGQTQHTNGNAIVRASAIFQGVRVQAPRDIDALAATLVAVSECAWLLRDRLRS